MKGKRQEVTRREPIKDRARDVFSCGDVTSDGSLSEKSAVVTLENWRGITTTLLPPGSEDRCKRYIRNREGRDDETRHLSPRTQNTHGTRHEEHRVRLRNRKSLATTNASACCEGARVHAQVLARALDGCNWALVTEFIATFRALNGREINHD